MAEERQSVPPMRKPVSLTLNPVHTDTFYIEVVSKTDPAYQQNAPIKRGTIYSSISGANQQVIDQYPLLYFAQETQVGNSDQLVQWRWVTDPLAEDTYNAEISYALESVTSPTYVRTYTVRRDVYDQLEPIAMGTPLTALIGVRIEDGGGNYTFATGAIDTGAEIDFVISEGVIISGIVTVEGSGVESDGEITITGDGAEARATAIIQPAGAVLIGQKKQEFPQDNPLNEEYVQLVRIYQTLPGPTIHSTRIDDDGIVVDIATTQKVASSIVSGETLTGVSPNQTWTKTTRKQEDNAYVGTEVVETRVIPGNPMPTTRLDEDGFEVSIVRTLKDATEVVTDETLIAGTWTKTYAEPATLTSTINVIDLVVKEVVESRLIPGDPVTSTRLDEDGIRVFVVRTMVETATFGLPDETLVAGVWTRKHLEAITELVGWSVVETRVIPGNPVPATRLDNDGVRVFVVRTMVETATFDPPDETVETVSGDRVWTRQHLEAITELVGWSVVEARTLPGAPVPATRLDNDGVRVFVISTLIESSTFATPDETISGGIWTRQRLEAVTDLVGKEIVEARDIPGNSIISYKVDEDHEIVFQATILKERTTIVPSATESGGNIHTVEAVEVTELAANEVTIVKEFLDESTFSVRIPDSVIPAEFRAGIPTVIEIHVVAGTASMPTLGVGEFARQERQLTKLLKQVTVETIEDVDFPIIQIGEEVSSEYGGAVLEVRRRLQDSDISADEGEDIVSSYVTPIGRNLMWFRETKKRPDSDVTWPLLPNRLWDEKMRLEYDETTQWVATGSTEDSNPGVFGWVSEVKAKDKWHAQRVNTSKSAPAYVDEASALITYDFKPFKFPGILTTVEVGAGGYYVRSAYAELIQHTIRTWWVSSTTTPVITVEDIIPENIIISTLNDVTELSYSGMVLHDEITTFGIFHWDATTPSYTEYIEDWQGVEHIIGATVTPEKDKDVWRIVTESVIFR